MWVKVRIRESLSIFAFGSVSIIPGLGPFECSLYACRRLGIGLATDSVKLVGGMPGWPSTSPWWGYHGDDGLLFQYDSRPIQLPSYLPYGHGDVVGCGIDFTSRTLFYTINGVKLGQSDHF